MRGAVGFVDRGRQTMHKYTTVEMLMTRDGSAVIDAKAIMLVENRDFLPTLPDIDTTIRGVPVRILLLMFGVVKLNWYGYQTVKTIRR